MLADAGAQLARSGGLMIVTDDRAGRLRRALSLAPLFVLTLPAAGCIQGHRALKASHERHNDAIQARVEHSIGTASRAI